MIKLRLDVKLKSRLHVKCDKHPTYNPEKHGVQGYRASCRGCKVVADTFLLWQRVRNAVSDYQAQTKPFETLKPRGPRKKVTETSPALDNAFKVLLKDVK